MDDLYGLDTVSFNIGINDPLMKREKEETKKKEEKSKKKEYDKKRGKKDKYDDDDGHWEVEEDRGNQQSPTQARARAIRTQPRTVVPRGP